MGTTATHVVCPVCGKSSSLKSFPAGGGKDLVLQTFRSLGRGKGFAVVARESGIDNRKLGSALTPKVLETLSILTSHGHTSTAEILAAVGAKALVAETQKGSETATKMAALESEIAFEKKTREFLEHEVTELQTSASRVLHHWRDEERRAAILQRQMNRLREPNERLIAATREGVESLQALRDELKGAGRGAKELGEHLRRMRAIVEAVQAVREAQNALPVERRSAHDAR